MQENNYLNQIIRGDVLDVIKEIPDSYVDLVLTDPPYFLDKLDNNWDFKKVTSKKNQKVIKSLPAGMKFDRTQGLRFYKWYLDVSKELYRVLKPGGFFFSFSSPRLYHRMASAVDDAGFLIRDCFLWIYTQNQAKAMSLDHFIDKMKIDKKEKVRIKARLKGWKTPQIKSCFEPIVMAQKPADGTFLENILKHKVGLFNTDVKVGENMYPANILLTDDIAAFDNMMHPEEESGLLEGLTAEQQAKMAYERKTLIPRTPQPRSRKVSLNDLMDALQKALETNRKRMLNIRLPQKMEPPKKKFDITELMRTVYNQVTSWFAVERGKKLYFHHIVPEDTREGKVLTFIPLLHLSNERKIDMDQSQHFGDIEIMLRTEKTVQEALRKEAEEAG